MGYCKKCKDFGTKRRCHQCNSYICDKCERNGLCPDCETMMDIKRKKSYNPKIINKVFVALIILLITLSVVSGVKIKDKDYTITSKEITQCDSSKCIIEYNVCNAKGSDQLMPFEIYDDVKSKKSKKVKYNKVLKKGCYDYVDELTFPLFALTKYGIKIGNLDLDPYVNQSYYIANFTIDNSSTTNLVIIDNRIDVVKSDLVDLVYAYYPFDVDCTQEISGNGFDGVNNGATFDFLNSKIGGSCIFETTESDYVQINNVTGSWVGDGGSFSVWARREAFNPSSHEVITMGEVTNGNKVLIAVDSAKWHSLSGNNINSNLQYTGLNDDSSVWHHLVFTWDSNGYNTWYIDGVNYGTVSTNTYDLSNSNLGAIGRNVINSGNYFDGLIDEVMISQQQLNQTNVNELYNSGAGFNPFNKTLTYLYESIEFEINTSLINFTPTFNSNEIILNISFDNGTSWFSDVTSGTTYLLDNSSFMKYRVSFETVNSFIEDLIIYSPSQVGFQYDNTIVTTRIINATTLNDLNMSVVQGNDFLVSTTFTRNVTTVIDPMLVYHLNEFSGVNVEDSTGGTSGLAVNINNSYWVDGLLLNNLYFDGNSYINTTEKDKFNFGLDDSFTFEFWSNSSTYSSFANVVFSNYYGGDDRSGYFGYYNPDGTFRVKIIISGGNYLWVRTNNASLFDGLYHYIVVSYNGSRKASGIKIYVDGVSESLQIINDNINSSDIINSNLNLIIGALPIPNYNIKGAIDEFLIYNYTVNQSTIIERYNNGGGKQYGVEILTDGICNANLEGVGNLLLTYDIDSNYYLSSTQNIISPSVKDLNVNCSINIPFVFNASSYTSIDVVNLLPVVSIDNINSVKEGLNNFSSGMILSTFNNVTQGNISISVNDVDMVNWNFSLSSNNSLVTTVLDQSLMNFNLTEGIYNISVDAIDSTGNNTLINDYFVVNLCSPNWVTIYSTCISGAPLFNGSQQITYIDSNNCRSNYNLPVDNGSIIGCYYTAQGSFNIPEGLAITPDKTTIAGMMIWIFWLLLVILAFVLAEHTKIPIFFILAGIFGAFFGWFVALQFSLLIGLIVIIFSLVYGMVRAF